MLMAKHLISQHIALAGLSALIEGCQSEYKPLPQDSATEINGSDSGGDTGFSYDTQDSAQEEEHAPEFITTSLPSGTVSQVYNATIEATDADGDRLEFILQNAPEWLMVNETTGGLYGTPDAHGTEVVEITVADTTKLTTTASFNLIINPLASLDLYVYDAFGETDSEPIDTSCNVEIEIIQAGTGYSEKATVDSSSIASFALDERGGYNIAVESTNTDSNCYGAFHHTSWFSVDEGENATSWVYLLPESKQNEVQESVGNALNMAAKEGYAAGPVDSVTKLFQFMNKTMLESFYLPGWDENIRHGTQSLSVETLDTTINDISYGDCLNDSLAAWEGYLAPTITMMSGPGADIIFHYSNWNDPNVFTTTSSDIVTIDSVLISYGDVDSYEDCVRNMNRVFGGIYFGMTPGVTDFIMNYPPEVNEADDMEKYLARAITRMGNVTPDESPFNGFSSYTNY